MATFTITDTATGQSVQVQLTFNIGLLTANTWQVTGGDASTLPVSSGVWNSDGLQNVLVIRDGSSKEIVRFDPINTAVSLSDPFSSLTVGDAGAGLFANSDIAGWSFDSR